jgi:hypothetical protein
MLSSRHPTAFPDLPKAARAVGVVFKRGALP